MQDVGLSEKQGDSGVAGRRADFWHWRGVAVSQLTHHAAPTRQANTANTATATDHDHQRGGDRTATTGAGAGANPTATTAPTATCHSPHAQHPTIAHADSVPAGQSIQIQGTVFSTSPSANSFTVQVGSMLYTVVVDANGTYPTSVKSVNQLQ